MGKFAYHLKLVSEQTHPCSFTSLEYTFVDYARLAALANEYEHSDSGDDGTATATAFREAWDEQLSRSASNFDEHYKTSSKIVLDAVFDGSTSEEKYGPNHPALTASDPRAPMEILIKHKGRDFVLDLFKDLKILLQTASLNAEALHLALKKFDKRRAAAMAEEGGLPAPTTGMMRELLPELYASTMYHAIGARSLSCELQIIRELLEEDEEEEISVEEDKNGNSYDASEMQAMKLSDMAESIKEEEYKWFMKSAERLGEKELASLVAHRGFHCEEDDSVTRPIENSLSSFEYAWNAGIHLAECDVGATKDDKVIMAHDESFARLALMSGEENNTAVVKDLTLADIMRMPLKHGSRPPLLVDVLRSAMAIGEHAKLVIEVKPGNSEIVEPLMALFNRHPALLSRVAIIMSFDPYVMQEIADHFSVSSMASMFGSGLGIIGEGTPVVSSSAMVSRQVRKTRASRVRHIQSVSYGSDNGSGGEVSAKPKLLVLTAFVDYGDFPHYLITSVKNDFEGLLHKLPVDNGIDGVYIEYEPEMLQSEGKERMLKLAESYTIGVWMLKPRDPDALSVAKRLVDECGVSYVNTDFHRDFFST